MCVDEGVVDHLGLGAVPRVAGHVVSLGDPACRRPLGVRERGQVGGGGRSDLRVHGHVGGGEAAGPGQVVQYGETDVGG
jgi:hypothetical protein